jgi:hypothetical protein
MFRNNLTNKDMAPVEWAEINVVVSILCLHETRATETDYPLPQ